MNVCLCGEGKQRNIYPMNVCLCGEGKQRNIYLMNERVFVWRG